MEAARQGSREDSKFTAQEHSAHDSSNIQHAFQKPSIFSFKAAHLVPSLPWLPGSSELDFTLYLAECASLLAAVDLFSLGSKLLSSDLFFLILRASTYSCEFLNKEQDVPQSLFRLPEAAVGATPRMVPAKRSGF